MITDANNTEDRAASPENEGSVAVSYQNSDQVLNDSSNANQNESDFNKNVDQQKSETVITNEIKKGKIR